ncbi:MAG: 50S ribosomal protein L11 methyltransferase [Longimicrobiales bacterium]
MQPRWLRVTVYAPSVESAARLAEGLFAEGASAVEEQPDHLVTCLQPNDEQEPEPYVLLLAQRLRAFNEGVAPDITWAWLPECDWSEEWKRGLAPRRVGERIIIAPSWTVPDAAPNDIVITIDPQMAFGTGEHASTRGALRLLERFMASGGRVLDLGSGSAVLAIAAARLGADEVVAVEADADALISAHENVARNHVEGQVRLVARLADAAYLQRLAAPRFDLIVANILSGVIVPLLEALRAALTERGTLIVAGILKEEAGYVRAAARKKDFTVLQEDCEDQWWAASLTPAHAADSVAR